MRTLALALAIGATLTPIAHADAWETSDAVDPITDFVSRSAYVRSGSYGLLGVSCGETGLFGFVQTKMIDMDFNPTRSVIWRTDNNPAQEQEWLNTKKSGAGITDTKAIEFARAARGASQRIVVRSGGETVTFTAEGSTEAIGNVLEHCGL